MGGSGRAGGLTIYTAMAARVERRGARHEAAALENRNASFESGVWFTLLLNCIRPSPWTCNRHTLRSIQKKRSHTHFLVDEILGRRRAGPEGIATRRVSGVHVTH